MNSRFKIKCWLSYKKLTRWYSLVKMTTETEWKTEKNRILNLPVDSRRENYKTLYFTTLGEIQPWSKYGLEEIKNKNPSLEDADEFKNIVLDSNKNSVLAGKVSFFRGDLTTLEIDAIVNAANSRLKAGGGVDGAIHKAAGRLLQEECNSIGGCATGDAKITGGYNLPAKYVIHTVGPTDGSAQLLQSCYEKSLSYCKEYKLRSIAFPCISTGLYGFPNRLAAHVALRTVRKFLEKSEDVDRVIFCTFMDVDVDIYQTLMQMYFPLQ